MKKDPIVEEVRAIRDAIAQEHNYDLDAIFRMLCDAETRSETVHVSPPPPKVEPLPKAAQAALGVGDGARR